MIWSYNSQRICVLNTSEALGFEVCFVLFFKCATKPQNIYCIVKPKIINIFKKIRKIPNVKTLKLFISIEDKYNKLKITFNTTNDKGSYKVYVYKSLAGMENATCGKHLSLTPKKARFLHFAKRKHEVFYEFW